MKDSYVACFAADYQIETFKTFEEAKKWLESMYDEEISEETQDGMDYIAKITHRSKFTITQDKEKDGYKWNENAGGYFIDGDPNNDEWYSEFDQLGQVELVATPQVRKGSR